MNNIIKAAGIPLIMFGFLPLWLFLKELSLGPDIGTLIDFLFASALTLSITYFGWKLRTQ